PIPLPVSSLKAEPIQQGQGFGSVNQLVRRRHRLDFQFRTLCESDISEPGFADLVCFDQIVVKETGLDLPLGRLQPIGPETYGGEGYRAHIFAQFEQHYRRIGTLNDPNELQFSIVDLLRLDYVLPEERRSTSQNILIVQAITTGSQWRQDDSLGYAAGRVSPTQRGAGIQTLAADAKPSVFADAP